MHFFSFSRFSDFEQFSLGMEEKVSLGHELAPVGNVPRAFRTVDGFSCHADRARYAHVNSDYRALILRLFATDDKVFMVQKRDHTRSFRGWAPGDALSYNAGVAAKLGLAPSADCAHGAIVSALFAEGDKLRHEDEAYRVISRKMAVL
jgi:hypothetical protein